MGRACIIPGTSPARFHGVLDPESTLGASMGMAAILLSLLAQADPYKTLADPAARAKDDVRKAALEAFRAAPDVPAQVAARFLERPEPPAVAELNAFLAKH